jgi:hypothetical protein
MEKDTHVLIATPCYGGVVHAGYMNSILELWTIAQKHGFKITVETLENESVFTRARAYYVARMLGNKQFTHLLNIDADIVFTAEGVVRMLEADKDVVGGCYPRKNIDWAKIQEAARDEDVDLDEIEKLSHEYIVNVVTVDFPRTNCQVINGFLQVGHIGGGFMLTKRNVIEKLADLHPELKFVGGIRGYNPPEFENNLYSLWEYMIDPISKRYLSDDFAFCKRWIQAGGEIWADINCKLTHIGAHSFEGDYAESLKYKLNKTTTSKTITPQHPLGCPTWASSC